MFKFCDDHLRMLVHSRPNPATPSTDGLDHFTTLPPY